MFGSAVAIDGDTAVVGAPYDDQPGGNGEASAYVFTRSGAVWTQQQRLYAADAAPGDHFADSVAISGDTVVAGTWEDDHAGGAGAGSAYAFIRSGNIWMQQQKLVADDAAPGDGLGFAVDVEGDLAVVGAIFDDDVALDGGSAYVFERSGGVWSQRQELPGDVVNGDLYGCTVAVSGNTIAAGAREDDTYGGVDSGSVTTYQNVGGVWSWGQLLTAARPPSLGSSGHSVSLSGDTLVIGQKDAIDWQVDWAGAAYVYTWTGSHWLQTYTQIGVSDTGLRHYGYAVAIDGNTVVVGAPSEGTGNMGRAEIFEWSHPMLTFQAMVEGDGAQTPYDWFGSAVDVDGDTVVVGASEDRNSSGVATGAAYVFVRSGNSWPEQASIQPTWLSGGDRFGYSVTVSGDTMVVGARDDDIGSGIDQGSAVVMTRTGSSWSQQALLTASDGATGHWFGNAVDLDGDTLIVGAPTTGVDTGAAYVFTRSGTTWTQRQVLVADDVSPGDQFGWDVAINGDTIVVRAPSYDAPGSSHGAAYVFTRDGTTWTQQQQLLTDGSIGNDFFGESVSVDGIRVAVGEPVFDLPVAYSRVGATYVFEPVIDLPFSDGFESGDTSGWSSTVP